MKYLIIFLFLLNLVSGILFINEGLFHCDSVFLAQAVENTYRTGTLHPAIIGRYGSVIINLITYFPFYSLGQNADFAVRFTGILFHALSIVALFLLVKELFNDTVIAFFSSLLLSFTPFYFSPNTYGKEHGMSIFIFLMSLYLLCRGINKRSFILIGISSLLAAFSVTIRESVMMTVPLFFLLYLGLEILKNKRVGIKPLLAVLAPFIILFAAVFFAYLNDALYRTTFIRTFAGLFSPTLLHALGDLLHSIPKILFIFFAIGLARMFSNKNLFIALFLSIWSLFIFYFGNTTVYCPRHLDIVIIPLYIFAAYVLADLYRKDKIISSAIIIYCVISMFVFMYPMLKFRHGYNGEKQFALYVKEKTEDRAVIIAMDDSPFIEYYGKRKALIPPLEDAGKIDEFFEAVEVYLNNKIPVYLIESGLSYDSNRSIENRLFKNFNVTVIGEKLTEDFHRPELSLQTYREKLFKITLKEAK